MRANFYKLQRIMKKINVLSLLLLVILFVSCSSDDSVPVVFNATKIVPEAQKTAFGPGKMGYYMCHVARLDAKDEGATYTWYINKVRQNDVNGDTCGFYCMKPDTVCHLAVDILKEGKTKHLETKVKNYDIEFATAGTTLADLLKNETMYSAMKYHRMPDYSYEPYYGGDADWHFKYIEENVCHLYTLTKQAKGVQYKRYHEYHKN